MHQLLLMRHAKSLWDDPTMTDHARPLNARGRQAAVSMGGALRDLGLAPDLVLVSSARRTLQTLEALAPWDDTPLIEPLDAIYLANAAVLTQVIQEVADTVRSLLVLGHNPGMHELAVSLAGGASTGGMYRRLHEGFPTGALAEFSLTGPWAGLSAGMARLERFITPHDLAERHRAEDPPL